MGSRLSPVDSLMSAPIGASMASEREARRIARQRPHMTSASGASMMLPAPKEGAVPTCEEDENVW